MYHVWSWGSWTKWCTAASVNGTEEMNIVSDGPQRKTTEESGPFNSAWGIVVLMHRDRRADVGKLSIAEAMTGKASWGIPEWSHGSDGEMEIFLKCWDRNRSAEYRLDFVMHQDKSCNAGNHPPMGELSRSLGRTPSARAGCPSARNQSRCIQDA